MRLTGGQYLSPFSPAGKQPSARGYGRFHSSSTRSSAVCGAFLSGLSLFDMRPVSISRISCRIAISASQKRSISAFDSDSVGSIINVPATGKLMVGAWKPFQRKPQLFDRELFFTYMRDAFDVLRRESWGSPKLLSIGSTTV